MMTILQLLSESVDIQRQYALVFSTQLAAALHEKWEEFGSTNCVLEPVALTDGRLVLSADLLSEVIPGGLLHAMWLNSDKSIIAAETEVMPWADAVAMLREEVVIY